jgi:hypothetical protein
VQRCYETAVWLVPEGGDKAHLCTKHTLRLMRDKTRWGKNPVPAT